ncbi:MAG: SET domain-containing protein-lysine N-methyltransferase [Rhizobiaceae bacterium]
MRRRATGFRFRYSVEQTAEKGLGVFAREAVRKGSIVWRHVPGVFTVYDEHSFRTKIEQMSPADAVYELTHVHALEDFPGCLIRALDDGILINHSSDPSLVTNNAGPARILLDASSSEYLRDVAEALGDDRYSLVATRDIEIGEEFTNDYTAEDSCPAYYDLLYEQYGIREDFLNHS